MRLILFLIPLLFSGCIIVQEKGGGGGGASADDTGLSGDDTDDPTEDDLDGDGYTVEEGDCDDDEETVYPGANEVCDGMDNDCDGLVDTADDDIDLSTARDWFEDADGDGYGTGSVITSDCDDLPEYADNDDDCDDDDDDVHPGADEECNGIDDDCNGIDDAMFPGVDGSETDNDGDGVAECDGDCDDTDADIGAGIIWFPDMDGDGYGDEDADGDLCDRPESWYVGNNEDCDDTNEYAYPGAPEIRANYVDEDCNGTDLRWLAFSFENNAICGIDENYDIVCAGSNDFERMSDAPDIGDGPFVEVEVGWEHVCARWDGGAVICWGDDEWDECWEAPEDPAGNDNYLDLATGTSNSLGISTYGYIMVWGRETADIYERDGDRLYEDSPSGSSWRQITASGQSACALMESGLMRCWGETSPSGAIVSDAPSSGTYTAVALSHGMWGGGPDDGKAIACAIQTDGDLECWGDTDTYEVDDVPSGSYTAVGVNPWNGCAISSGGSIRCWGHYSGFLADEPSGSDYRSIQLDTDNQAACAHDDYGYITCWGTHYSNDLIDLCRNEEDPGEPYFGCDYYDPD